MPLSICCVCNKEPGIQGCFRHEMCEDCWKLNVTKNSLTNCVICNTPLHTYALQNVNVMSTPTFDKYINYNYGVFWYKRK